MAHEIETINGQQAFAFTGQRKNIWHGLGTQIPDDCSPDQIMEKASLNWNVLEEPVYAVRDNVAIGTGHKALIRDIDNRVLDVVPLSWIPVQNRTMFDFFHDFVSAGDLSMDTAGSVREGQMVFATAKIKNSVELFGSKDLIEQYLLFSNPHQFGQALTIRVTTVRVVCANTLTRALKERGDLQVRMTHRSTFDPSYVKDALKFSEKRMAEYQKSALQLGSKFYTAESMIEYYKRVFPAPNSELTRNAQRCIEVIDTQPGAEIAKGTFWQLWNSITYSVDHQFGREGESSTISAMYGTTNRLKYDALRIAMEMTA